MGTNFAFFLFDLCGVSCLHVQFLKDMCTALTWIRFVLAYSIPIGYVHKVYILNCLTIFRWKIHWDIGGLTGEYDSVEKCFDDDSDLPWSFDDVWPTKEGVAYWGFSNGMLFTRELPSTGEMIIFFFLINHWGLMLTPPLRGFYQNLLGKFCLASFEGATSVPWTHGGVHLWCWIYLGFSWWSWLTEEHPWWFLVHWGMFDALNPLWIFLGVLIRWEWFWCS